MSCAVKTAINETRNVDGFYRRRLVLVMLGRELWLLLVRGPEKELLEYVRDGRLYVGRLYVDLERYDFRLG